MTTFQIRPGTSKKPLSPDLAVAAMPLFRRVTDRIRKYLPRIQHLDEQQKRWGVPPVFFFRDSTAPRSSETLVIPEALRVERNELCTTMEDALSFLQECISCRQLARAIPDLWKLSQSLAAYESVARNFADMLAVADEVVVRVILPKTRQGIRVRANAMRDLGEFAHVLQETLAEQKIRRGFSGDWQLFRPTALLADGKLPEDARGCDHWFWGTERFDKIPLDSDGERTLLFGPAVVRTCWDRDRGPTRLQAELELLQVLSQTELQEWFGRHLGEAPAPIRQAA
jgi:hypothetical protein